MAGMVVYTYNRDKHQWVSMTLRARNKLKAKTVTKSEKDHVEADFLVLDQSPM